MNSSPGGSPTGDTMKWTCHRARNLTTEPGDSTHHPSPGGSSTGDTATGPHHRGRDLTGTPTLLTGRAPRDLRPVTRKDDYPTEPHLERGPGTSTHRPGPGDPPPVTREDGYLTEPTLGIYRELQGPCTLLDRDHDQTGGGEGRDRWLPPSCSLISRSR